MGFLIIFNSNWGKDEPTILHYAIMKNVPWALTSDRFREVFRPSIGKLKYEKRI
jgi:hypothetical protein